MRNHSRLVTLVTAASASAALTIAVAVSGATASHGSHTATRLAAFGSHRVAPSLPRDQNGFASAVRVSPTLAATSALSSLRGNGLGTVDVTSVRALAVGIAAGDGTLYGALSSTGALCYVLTPGPQGCA